MYGLIKVSKGLLSPSRCFYLKIKKYLHNMTTLNCEIDEKSAEFKENYSKMMNTMQTFHNIIAENMKIDAKAKARHFSKNKLLVRDRINKILDPGSSFLEFSQIAGYRLYPGETLSAAGIITGIGKVSGHLCMIIANDALVKGGSYYPITVEKSLRAQEIAEENCLPCIYLSDSGGANLQYQASLFAHKESFGKIFYNLARMSSKGIPQVATVFGNCTAGGAYIPSMTDETVIVRENGTIFLAGPPLVKAATGEIVNADDLGGANLHCRVTGLSDYYAENEEEALQITKNIMKRIMNGEKQHSSTVSVFNQIEPKEPLYPPEYLYGILNPHKNNNFDIKKVIACLVDGSELDEFKKNFGETLVTGFARINGHLIGIIGNNGILQSSSSLKGAHFIELCCQRKIPLLFMQNTTGFLVGRESEEEGVCKHGAKLLTAVSCAQVPKITLIVGSAYGAGYYAMCGRSYRPKFLYTWPNVQMAIMGGQQAADVLATVSSKLSESEKEKMKTKLMEQIEEESSPYYGSARLWDDGVIDPAETRKILSLSLSVCLKEAVNDRAEYGIFRM